MYCFFTTQKTVSEASAKRINQRIKAIDASAEFVGPVNMPGNLVRGWIERPDDGTNAQNDVRERNEAMATIAREEIDD